MDNPLTRVPIADHPRMKPDPRKVQEHAAVHIADI